MHNTSIPRNGLIVPLGSVVVGLYTWIATASFGAVLLDIVYYKSAPGAAAAFAEAADLLLLLGAVTVFAALGAIALAWTSSAARNLLIASLLIIVFGLFAPALLSPLLRNAGLPLGTGIRLLITGLPSVLALSAFYRLHRNA